MFYKKILSVLILVVVVGGAWFLLRDVDPATLIQTRTVVTTTIRTIFVTTSSPPMAVPILTREKNRLIHLYSEGVDNIVAQSGFDTEVLWTADNDVWRVMLAEQDYDVQLVTSTPFPTKQVAVSTDGKYVAYSVRRFPFPPRPKYWTNNCEEGLGDSVVVHDRSAKTDTLVYTSSSTVGVSNIQFLPGRHDVVFVDQGEVYQVSLKTGVVKKLLGFTDDKESPLEYTDTCDKLYFYAFSPSGRYALAYHRGRHWAVDMVYDFVQDKLTGSFVYPWDFGGTTVLGFIADDLILAYDDSYMNFQHSNFPQLSLFNLQGDPILTIATTSPHESYVLPDVFATSTLGWHIMLYPRENQEQSYIFNPQTFQFTSTTLRQGPSALDVIWKYDYEASNFSIVSNRWSMEPYRRSDVVDVVVR